jgi:hypothetical protein
MIHIYPIVNASLRISFGTLDDVYKNNPMKKGRIAQRRASAP